MVLKVELSNSLTCVATCDNESRRCSHVEWSEIRGAHRIRSILSNWTYLPEPPAMPVSRIRAYISLDRFSYLLSHADGMARQRLSSETSCETKNIQLTYFELIFLSPSPEPFRYGSSTLVLQSSSLNLILALSESFGSHSRIKASQLKPILMGPGECYLELNR